MYAIFKNSLRTSQQAQSATDRPAGNVIYYRNDRKHVKYTVCRLRSFLYCYIRWYVYLLLGFYGLKFPTSSVGH